MGFRNSGDNHNKILHKFGRQLYIYIYIYRKISDVKLHRISSQVSIDRSNPSVLCFSCCVRYWHWFGPQIKEIPDLTQNANIWITNHQIVQESKRTTKSEFPGGSPSPQTPRLKDCRLPPGSLQGLGPGARSQVPWASSSHLPISPSSHPLV